MQAPTFLRRNSVGGKAFALRCVFSAAWSTVVPRKRLKAGFSDDADGDVAEWRIHRRRLNNRLMLPDLLRSSSPGCLDRKPVPASRSGTTPKHLWRRRLSPPGTASTIRADRWRRQPAVRRWPDAQVVRGEGQCRSPSIGTAPDGFPMNPRTFCPSGYNPDRRRNGHRVPGYSTGWNHLRR